MDSKGFEGVKGVQRGPKGSKGVQRGPIESLIHTQTLQRGQRCPKKSKGPKTLGVQKVLKSIKIHTLNQLISSSVIALETNFANKVKKISNLAKMK